MRLWLRNRGGTVGCLDVAARPHARGVSTLRVTVDGDGGWQQLERCWTAGRTQVYRVGIERARVPLPWSIPRRRHVRLRPEDRRGRGHLSGRRRAVGNVAADTLTLGREVTPSRG